MDITVYDFDKTIYKGDSSLNFYFFCVLKKPLLLSVLPKQALAALGFALKITPKKKFKESFFCFLKGVKDPLQMAQLFWLGQAKNIKSFYWQDLSENKVIISASPEFLLAPMAKILGAHIIASPVEPNTGKFKGENCYGKEKVARLKEKYPSFCIKAFYSDSASDLPLAILAEKAYFVKKNRLSPWKYIDGKALED